MTATPTCVAHGATETVAVKTDPGVPVAFNTYYSDGKPGGSMGGGGYGGNSGGITDSAGAWSYSWVISAAAPAGPVRVDVIVSEHGTAYNAHGAFAVASLGGSC